MLESWIRKLCSLKFVFQRPDEFKVGSPTLKCFLDHCFENGILWYGKAHLPEWALWISINSLDI
jgi:hypothetical protein